MQSHINPLILVCLISLASVAFAQDNITSPEKSVTAAGPNEAAALSFPYVAVITGDDVYVRSGPGTQYYSCGKLNKLDRVKAVGSKFSWSHIVPPAGSFSWISKQYVDIDPSDPTSGIVTGDAVRVYAGSENIKPMHSTTVQVKLNNSDKVKLLGEEKDDYYKIAPPEGAYLWVSTQYTEFLGPVGKVPLTVLAPQPDTEEVVATDISVEARKLKEYYALQKQIEAEQAKPTAQQDYTGMKKALLEIAGNKKAGKAARYSKFGVKQVGRFELALAVGKKVQLQDKQFQQIKERIEKARTKRLAEVRDLGKFTVIGQFQTSSIYGPEEQLKHYRIINDSGKTICYALPSGSTPKAGLDKFVGRKVGLIGTVEPYTQVSGALVRFAEIVELQ